MRLVKRETHKAPDPSAWRAWLLVVGQSSAADVLLVRAWPERLQRYFLARATQELAFVYVDFQLGRKGDSQMVCYMVCAIGTVPTSGGDLTQGELQSKRRSL